MNPRTVVTVVALSAIASATSVLAADKLAELNVDSRLQLGFQAPDTEVQKWLPASWRVNPLSAPPAAKGVNLVLLFVERFLSQTPEGKPNPTASELSAALVVFGKHTGTGEESLFVSRIYSPDAVGLPGPYRNSVKADVRREMLRRVENLAQGSASDQWEVDVATGGKIFVRLAYERPLPLRTRAELRPRSSIEPDFYRIYRVDQGNELLRSLPAGVDRIKAFEFRNTVPELTGLLADANLLSVTAIPWYVRQLSLPVPQ